MKGFIVHRKNVKTKDGHSKARAGTTSVPRKERLGFLVTATNGALKSAPGKVDFYRYNLFAAQYIFITVGLPNKVITLSH